MLIRVTYNKSTGDITLVNDITEVELTKNDIQDSSDELSFEIGVDTSYYEEINSFDFEELNLENPEE